MSRNFGLDQAIELILSIGLVASAGLLVAGLALQAEGPLRWGIVLLMLTPVARVVVLTLGLFLARDFFFGSLSLGILMVLVFSMLVGSRFL